MTARPDTRRDCTHITVTHLHGTEQAYISDRCGCQPCKRAHAEKAAWRRRQHAYGRDVAGLVSVIGSRRRINALARIGWSTDKLARRLGWDPVVMQRVRHQAQITNHKARAIADLFDELWDTPAPTRTKGERISAVRTIRHAERRGWPPALAWDDIDNPDEKPKHRLADTAALHRDVILPRLERVAALTAQGLSAQEIAVRLGTTPRLVTRDRARIRQLQGETAA